MIKLMTCVILFIHGFIHFMGFAKAFHYGDLKQLTIPVSKPVGLLWLATAVLFILAAISFLKKKESWWMIASVAVVLSQSVILLSWKDAKYGTVANLFILLTIMAAWGSQRFENSFRKDVKTNLATNNSAATALVTDADLLHLPPPVQRYLKYAGVPGKPVLKNMHVVFEGEMREKGKKWFPFTSEQYNFFDEPARLFFMKAKLFGVTVPGYHCYMHATATMDIRLFGLFPIVQKSGLVMNRAETVTLFNDMCLLAPATLIDKRIEWEAIDNNTAKAVFSNGANRISATLIINEQGQLVNFRSNDRTAVADMQQYPFSTPCGQYKTFNGYHLQSEGNAVWHYPEGEFIYGKFRLKAVEYNVSGLQ